MSNPVLGTDNRAVNKIDQKNPSAPRSLHSSRVRQKVNNYMSATVCQIVISITEKDKAGKRTENAQGRSGDCPCK